MVEIFFLNKIGTTLKKIEIAQLIITALVPIIMAAIIAFVKKKYKKYKESRNEFRNYQLAQNKLIFQKLDEIKSEFRTNGGSTVKDDLMSLKDNLTHINTRLDSITIEQRINREIMDIANWESDSEGQIKYVSTALCDIIGCTQSELLDSSWVGFVDTADRKRVFDEWMESVKMASEFNTTFHYKKPNGTFQKVKAVAIHIKDNRGRVRESLGRVTILGEPIKR